MSNQFNLNPGTLHELQKELFGWQIYNFGTQDSERVIMGMCEEAGELCHAQLKLEQGIRGSREDLEAKMFDAIGDISIYMLNYLSMIGEKLPAFVGRNDVARTDDDKLIRKSVFSVYRLVGKISEDPGKISRVQPLISSLLYLCAQKGWDLGYIIRKTWSEIGQRDWKLFPGSGFPAE